MALPIFSLIGNHPLEQCGQAMTGLLVAENIIRHGTNAVSPLGDHKPGEIVFRGFLCFRPNSRETAK